MRIWLDVHLPPALIPWLKTRFGVEVDAFRNAGLTRATDSALFDKLRAQDEVVMTKDSDFVALVESRGSPTQVIWLTCGNTSNRNLKRILEATLGDPIQLLAQGESVVEIRDS